MVLCSLPLFFSFHSPAARTSDAGKLDHLTSWSDMFLCAGRMWVSDSSQDSLDCRLCPERLFFADLQLRMINITLFGRVISVSTNVVFASCH
jgi:hypothetical protein